MFKRGYQNGEKIIEVIEGNIDVVLYNEKGTTFYFYRFSPEDILGIELSSNTTMINQKEVTKFLASNGKTDYAGFINELIATAVERKMAERYDL